MPTIDGWCKILIGTQLGDRTITRVLCHILHYGYEIESRSQSGIRYKEYVPARDVRYLIRKELYNRILK